MANGNRTDSDDTAREAREQSCGLQLRVKVEIEKSSNGPTAVED